MMIYEVGVGVVGEWKVGQRLGFEWNGNLLFGIIVGIGFFCSSILIEVDVF